MPFESSHNRGARGDSSFMLDAMASSSEKPPLQMRSIKWWEYVTDHVRIKTENGGGMNAGKIRFVIVIFFCFVGDACRIQKPHHVGDRFFIFSHGSLFVT